MDIQVSMGGKFLTHHRGRNELSPLSPLGPRSGADAFAMSSPAPSLGPALCPKQSSPQGHFLSLRTAHVPAELHSFLCAIGCTPDQIRGHGQTLGMAREQRPQAEKEQPSLGLSFGGWQGKPQGIFQRQPWRGLTRLPPAFAN